MRDQQTSLCKLMTLERKCTDGVERLRVALENQVQHGGLSGADVWDRTLSFFSLKRAVLFPNGYSKQSRDALRLFPHPADDVMPLWVQ